MKTAVLYVSVHHGNTKKVAEAIAEIMSADLFDLNLHKNIDISNYDIIGLASGCFYHSIHSLIKEFVKNTDFMKEQKIFLVCTCGIPYRDYTKSVKKLLKNKNINIIGSFQCRGFDTFGPFAKIGGIAKNHPNDKDISKAKQYARILMKNN